MKASAGQLWSEARRWKRPTTFPKKGSLHFPAHPLIPPVDSVSHVASFRFPLPVCCFRRCAASTRRKEEADLKRNEKKIRRKRGRRFLTTLPWRLMSRPDSSSTPPEPAVSDHYRLAINWCPAGARGSQHRTTPRQDRESIPKKGAGRETRERVRWPAGTRWKLSTVSLLSPRLSGYLILTIVTPAKPREISPFFVTNDFVLTHVWSFFCPSKPTPIPLSLHAY